MPHPKGDWRWNHDGRWQPRRPGCLFLWFLLLFGLMALLVLGGMAVLAFMLVRWMDGPRHLAGIVWLSGCGMAIALSLLALFLANRAFRGIATPLSEVMDAADKVAEGDLSVRVAEGRSGPFGQLATSFNHMTAELETADTQRRQLTADVAHELRTPLHIIQGNLEGVLDGVYEPTPDHIESTLEETHLLARLVEDLRTISLAESGQLPLRREPVDVADLLADAATSFSGQAEAKGIELTTAVNQPTGPSNPHPLIILGDGDRMDQVLGNLLVNALRHTPKGGCITLTAVSHDTHIAIHVADTGEGIAPEDLPHIFNRFWRGDRARSHTAGVGGGLGLAIVRQLVLAMGGQIEVQSTRGEGTTFELTFPRVEA